MFGIFRLFLATLVAFSHFGVIYKGFNPGQWAVVAFYLLSGYLMQKQAEKLCKDGGVASFYIDRAIRILPLYLLVLVFGAWVVPVSAGDFAWNVLLFPLNYSTLTGVPVVVGPAWSLACEAHFYLLVPLFYLMRPEAMRSLLVLSILLFVVSPALPNAGFWAYTGLPGILFTFLCGMLLARNQKWVVGGVWIVMSVLLVGFASLKFFAPSVPAGIHINVCIGFSVFLPAVVLLSRLPSAQVLDKRIGLLSYPLFLCHEPVAMALSGFFGAQHPVVNYLAALVASVLLVVCFEMPIDRVRYKLRARAAGRPV